MMIGTRRDTGFDSDVTTVDDTVLQSTSAVDTMHNVATEAGKSRRTSRFFSFWRSNPSDSDTAGPQDSDKAGPVDMAPETADAVAAPNLFSLAPQQTTQM